MMGNLWMEDASLQGFISDRTVLDCPAYWLLYKLDKDDEVGKIYLGKCLSQVYVLLMSRAS